jgi:peptidoglycan/xylan/chitin deacetylase (PgdA/CDA1 family)
LISRRQFLKLCLNTTIAATFLPSTLVAGAERSIPVIVYHRVGYTEGQLTITPERFAADLKSLAEAGYRTISIKQFYKFIEGNETELPGQPVLITFDDGYRDNYENAFPVLQRYSMAATFFVITGMVDTAERVTSSQIMEMAHYGMSIGSHTVSHRSLAELSTEEALRELTMSRDQLADILGKKVEFFAYPRGAYTSETISCVKEAGYVGAFTVRQGRCLKQSPHYTLRRIPVFRSDDDILQIIAARGDQ